jgi:transcription termination/antitermination protein NusG
MDTITRDSMGGALEHLAKTALPQWFAVQTRYRFEKRVAEQLNNKGMEIFLPLRNENHIWSDRQKAVTIPLFPGYAFVRLDGSLDSRRNMLQTAGLIGFVNFGGTPASVPPTQIEDLRLLLREKVSCSLYPFMEVGRRVRIKGGCLNGLEGVLAQHDEGKLVISIDSIQRSLTIAIQGYELEAV